MLTWIQSHPFALPIAMFIWNTVVSNLPDPDSSSGKLYKFFYGTMHGIIGGLGNVIFAATNQPPLNISSLQTGQAHALISKPSNYDIK